MKHLRYLSYVVRHKWFVLVAGLRVRAPLWRLLVHDWSKFLPSEWIPYVRRFYGGRYPDWCTAQRQCPGYSGPTEESVARDFDRAWLYHQRRNPHHWQFWLLVRDTGEELRLPMPEGFVREMIADWMGAGRAITGKWGAAEWYLKNADRIRLHPWTERRVRELLGVA
jgi:hypothetical protein